MKEKPILFSAPMVQAILDNRKSQTRRVIKPLVGAEKIEGSGQSFFTPDGTVSIRGIWHGMGGCEWHRKPLVVPGDRLWVKETWKIVSDAFGLGSVANSYLLRYAADKKEWWQSVPKDKRKEAMKKYGRDVDNPAAKWRPSIFMPRWASRINLEVTAVRAELLQDISEADAVAEGIEKLNGGNLWKCCEYARASCYGTESATAAFSKLWDSINGKKYPYSSNPAVWVYTFKRVENAV